MTQQEQQMIDTIKASGYCVFHSNHGRHIVIRHFKDGIDFATNVWLGGKDAVGKLQAVIDKIESEKIAA